MKKKQTLYFCKGLPASGKDTIALEMIEKSNGKLKRVNKDLLRVMVDNNKWSHGREIAIPQSRDTLIELWLSKGYDVICTDTNLAPKHQHTFENIVKGTDVELECIDLTSVDIHECILRDAKRENSAGSKVITNMYYKYLFDNSNWTKPIKEPASNVVICDLDGCLAIHNGRSPYDSSRYSEDLFNYHLWFLIKDKNLIFLSGREGTKEARKMTVDWLKKYTGLSDDFFLQRLFMREEGDSREDSIIKMEIYDRDIEPHYNVVAVIDDRSRVVSAWRQKGLLCLQLNFGDF